MAELEAIVFDLDGTLIDSAPELTRALNATLAEYGRGPLPVEEVKLMIGDGIDRLIERGFTATGSPAGEKQLAALGDRVREFYWNAGVSKLYPGVLETLEKFRGHRVKLAVCTNKPYEPTMHILRGLGIGDHFAAVGAGDSYRTRKPDPGPLRAILNALGTTPATTVMVGDSPNDVGTARGAGVPIIAVSYGYSRVPVQQLGADVLVERFDEIPAAIAELGFA